VKAEAARIFKAQWEKAKTDPVYVAAKARHAQRYEK
jgi:hypothetical protein